MNTQTDKYQTTASNTGSDVDFMLTIGLFGTCGGSTWRDKFMQTYDELGIPYFNPQVDDWKPELAEIEAQHLVKDGIILFPVTSETYGTGSLCETGFSILSVIKHNQWQNVIIMIDDSLDEGLHGNAEAAKESLRARKLLREHLKKVEHGNVHVVDTLEEMFQQSIILYSMYAIKFMAHYTEATLIIKQLQGS